MAKLSTTKRRKPVKTPILVIEDNADHWLIIRSALSQCFPEVEPIWMNHAEQVENYLEACILTAETLPRLMLMDLYMPRKEDSFSLLEFIKNHPVYRQVPIVMLSSSSDNSDIEKLYTYSVASYIVKPLTYDQWLKCFTTFRRYWLDIVTLPKTLN